MILDFARAGREPFLALLALNKIKNASLPLGQHVEWSLNVHKEASSNEQVAKSACWFPKLGPKIKSSRVSTVIPSGCEESRTGC
jgi:hypothetical protein